MEPSSLNRAGSGRGGGDGGGGGSPIVIYLDSVRISPLSRWKVRTRIFTIGGWSGVLQYYQQFFQSRRLLGVE